MRSVNEEGRLRIVEMMWELVYADGQVSEFEDNVVWRAADLLGVSSRDRIDLKHRVAEQRTPATGSQSGSQLGSTRQCQRPAVRMSPTRQRDAPVATGHDEILMCRTGRCRLRLPPFDCAAAGRADVRRLPGGDLRPA